MGNRGLIRVRMLCILMRLDHMMVLDKVYD